MLNLVDSNNPTVKLSMLEFNKNQIFLDFF